MGFLFSRFFLLICELWYCKKPSVCLRMGTFPFVLHISTNDLPSLLVVPFVLLCLKASAYGACIGKVSELSKSLQQMTHL